MGPNAVKKPDGAARAWGTPRPRPAEGRPRRRRAGRAALPAALAALAVCAALAAALLLGRRGGDGRAGDRPSPAPARAAAPRPARTKAAAPEAAPAPRPAPVAEAAAPELRTYRDARGVLRYEGGLRVPGQRPLARPIELGAHRPKVFRHAAEEHISWLLDMKVGEPVEVLDTDDARTRELKAAVQETKEELRRRMEAGEDVAEIMNDALDEHRRLARYRRELQERLREIRADAGTYDGRDVEDFTKAANELLAREGLPPLAMPRAVMRGLRRR